MVTFIWNTKKPRLTCCSNLILSESEVRVNYMQYELLAFEDRKKLRHYRTIGRVFRKLHKRLEDAKTPFTKT